MDSARCVCKVMGAAMCAIHGKASADPQVPYVLNENDRKLLKSFRISTHDPDDIDDTYRSDLEERR